MKNLVDYLNESICAPENIPVAQNQIHINIPEQDLSKMQQLWRDIAFNSKQNYINNSTYSLKDDKDKRVFIEWLNKSVFNFQWRLKEVSSMTYELFYLPQENNTDSSSLKYIQNVFNKLKADCECNSEAVISTVKESLNSKETAQLKEYYLLCVRLGYSFCISSARALIKGLDIKDMRLAINTGGDSTTNRQQQKEYTELWLNYLL